MYSKLTKEDRSKAITSPDVIAEILTNLLLSQDEIEQDKEHFIVIDMSVRNKIKSIDIVSIGSLSASIVHPRETFRRAIGKGSAQIIIAHNHPSGIQNQAMMTLGSRGG